MGVALAAIAALTGALLISWSVLLYDSEEQRVADALASWWVRLDDLATSASARNKLLIRIVAEALDRWLRVAHKRAYLLVVCVLLAVGVMALVVGGFIYSPTPFRVLAFPAGLLLGLATDFLVIVLIRRLVLDMARSVTFVKAFAVAVASALLGIVMLATLALSFYDRDQPFSVSYAIGLLAGTTNVYAGVVAFAFVAVNTMFALQRVLWPVIARPLYAVQRFELFQQRRTFFYCGATLIALGFPKVADLLLRALQRF